MPSSWSSTAAVPTPTELKNFTVSRGVKAHDSDVDKHWSRNLISATQEWRCIDKPTSIWHALKYSGTDIARAVAAGANGYLTLRLAAVEGDTNLFFEGLEYEDIAAIGPILPAMTRFMVEGDTTIYAKVGATGVASRSDTFGTLGYCDPFWAGNAVASFFSDVTQQDLFVVYLSAPGAPTLVHTGTSNMYGVAVYQPTEKVIFGHGTQLLQRNCVGFGGLATLDTLGSTVFGVEADQVNGHIYYTNKTTINRCDVTTGANKVELANSLTDVWDLAADPANGFLYYTDATTGEIRKLLMDSPYTDTGVVSGLGTDIRALDLDVESEYIYFSDEVAGAPRIHRVNLDGSGSVYHIYTDSPTSAAYGLYFDTTTNTLGTVGNQPGVLINRWLSPGGLNGLAVEVSPAITATTAALAVGNPVYFFIPSANPATHKSHQNIYNIQITEELTGKWELVDQALPS